MHQRALRIPEKLLTSRRSSPAPSSSLRSGRPPRRSAAGPGWRFVRLRWRHPAFGSPSESNPPFPGSPSLRSQREEFPPSVYMLSLLFLSRAQSRAALDYFFFFFYLSVSSSVCQITSDRTLYRTPLQAPQGRRMISFISSGDPCNTPSIPLGDVVSL